MYCKVKPTLHLNPLMRWQAEALIAELEAVNAPKSSKAKNSKKKKKKGASGDQPVSDSSDVGRIWHMYDSQGQILALACRQRSSKSVPVGPLGSFCGPNIGEHLALLWKGSAGRPSCGSQNR